MNILLLEPDPLTARLVTHTLTKSSQCSIQWQQSGQAGLDAMDTIRPDIIVLEVQLGIHNGIEFLYEIRSYPEWQSIPIVIYTINRMVLDQAFGFAWGQLGVVSILYKPEVSLEELRRTLVTTLTRI